MSNIGTDSATVPVAPATGASTAPSAPTAPSPAMYVAPVSSPSSAGAPPVDQRSSQYANGSDLPPSYQDATDPNAPPPTYESIYGRVRNARHSSRGPWEFVQRLFTIIIGTVVGTVCFSLVLAVTLVVPLTLMIIGSVHLRHCPAQPALPVWLMIGGVMYVLRSSHVSVDRMRSRLSGNPVEPPSAVTNGCVAILQLAWYILGCVWVYSIPQPSFDPSKAVEGHYCHPTLYLACYYLLAALHLLVLILVLCGCCVCGAIHTADTSVSAQQQQQQEQQRSFVQQP